MIVMQNVFISAQRMEARGLGSDAVEKASSEDSGDALVYDLDRDESCDPLEKGCTGDTNSYDMMPKNIQDCLEWSTRNLRRMAAMSATFNTDFIGNLQANSRDGLVVTTCYSGAGTAEMAANIALNFGVPWCPEDNNLVLYSSCDADATSQKVLMAHDLAHRPLHLFTDVLDRLPDDVRAFCLQIQQKHMRKYHILKAMKNKPRKKKRRLQNSQQEIAHLEQDYLLRLHAVLQETKFNEEAYCQIHCQKCNINPRSNPELAKHRWLEVAGTTCCPFSSIGKRGGFLDDATLPCLVWWHSSRRLRPSDILHECVPSFNPDVFDDSSHDELDSTTDGEYKRFSIIFSPVHLGVPSSRSRIYSWFNANIPVDTARFHRIFRSLFFHDCATTAKIYIVVPDSVRALHREAWARQQGQYVIGDNSSVVACVAEREYFLPFGCDHFRQRWLAYADRSCCGRRRSELPECHLIPCDQSPEYYRRSCKGDVVPTLMRHSSLFDIISGCEVLPAEHFLIQGFPVPEVGLSSELCAFFPFSSIFSHLPVEDRNSSFLSDAQMRRLAGNSFHVAAVGAMMQFMWSVHPELPVLDETVHFGDVD